MPFSNRAVLRSLAFAALIALWGNAARGEEAYRVAEYKTSPEGLSADVKSAIHEAGFRISGPSGVVCDVWLAKDVKLKPGFKPTLRVKYPFSTGTLLGAIRLAEGGERTDFRGQVIKPGIYTLRSGLQPDDGNHLGTSEIRDFLVACPADKDADPKRIDKVKNLFKLSAQAAGTGHPAIFLLQAPGEKPFAETAVRYDASHKLVTLSVNVTGKDSDKSVTVPMNLVTAGKSDH